MSDLIRIFHRARRSGASGAFFLWASASSAALLVRLARARPGLAPASTISCAKLARFNPPGAPPRRDVPVNRKGHRRWITLHATAGLAPPRNKNPLRNHLSVFREFLAQLDALQREAQTPRIKPPRKTRGSARTATALAPPISACRPAKAGTHNHRCAWLRSGVATSSPELKHLGRMGPPPFAGTTAVFITVLPTARACHACGRCFPFPAVSLSPEGTIEGYASLFGEGRPGPATW